jgi:hypothetical protein
MNQPPNFPCVLNHVRKRFDQVSVRVRVVGGVITRHDFVHGAVMPVAIASYAGNFDARRRRRGTRNQTRCALKISRSAYRNFQARCGLEANAPLRNS